MRKLLLAAVLVAGCAKDKDPAPAAAVPAPAPVAAAPAAAPPVAVAAAAPAAPGTVPAAVNGFPNAQQIAALQQQALAQAGAAQQKTAINWRTLTPLLNDDLAGWKAAGEAKGETTAMGAMSMSKAERGYDKDGKHARVEIIDTAVMPALANAFQMTRMASSDASDHYARGFDVGGNPGWEEWRKGGNATATALIGGRFLVKAQTNGATDAKSCIEIIQKLDNTALAALNK